MLESTLTRRRALRLAVAGGVAVASTTVALSGPLTDTLFASQAASTVRLLGVQAGPLPTTNDVPEVDVTELDSAGNPVTGSLPVTPLIQIVDVLTGRLTDVSTPRALSDGAPILQSNETISGLTTLASGTVVMTIDPTPGAPNETGPTRLVFMSTPPTAVSVSGLKNNERLGDVVGTADGGLLGLVMKRNGTPPTALVSIDPGTGAMSVVNTIRLAQTRRFRTLALCSDGTLFTTGVGRAGDTAVVRLDPHQKKVVDVVPLIFNGKPWDNGLESLMCTAENQPRLLALGAPRYVTPNAVYAIDVATGDMAKLLDVAVVKGTLARA